jgi:hypothetical protein
VFFEYNERKKNYATPLDFYNQYLQGKANGVGLQKYSRKKNLTKQLVELLDEQKQLNPK